MTRTPARWLAEVVKKAGVSDATVNRELNGRADVCDSTEEAVQAAFAEHARDSGPGVALVVRGSTGPAVERAAIPAVPAAS